MYDKLLELEKSFFKHSFISDRNWLDAVLHKEFKECGASGEIFGRGEVIADLLMCGGDRDIKIYNFECSELVSGCWMVHYITKKGGKKYYRTSIWVTEKDPIQLIFHQASFLKTEINLEES